MLLDDLVGKAQALASSAQPRLITGFERRPATPSFHAAGVDEAFPGVRLGSPLVARHDERLTVSPHEPDVSSDDQELPLQEPTAPRPPTTTPEPRFTTVLQTWPRLVAPPGPLPAPPPRRESPPSRDSAPGAEQRAVSDIVPSSSPFRMRPEPKASPSAVPERAEPPPVVAATTPASVPDDKARRSAPASAPPSVSSRALAPPTEARTLAAHRVSPRKEVQTPPAPEELVRRDGAEPENAFAPAGPPQARLQTDSSTPQQAPPPPARPPTAPREEPSTGGAKHAVRLEPAYEPAPRSSDSVVPRSAPLAPARAQDAAPEALARPPADERQHGSTVDANVADSAARARLPTKDGLAQPLLDSAQASHTDDSKAEATRPERSSRRFEEAPVARPRAAEPLPEELPQPPRGAARAPATASPESPPLVHLEKSTRVVQVHVGRIVVRAPVPAAPPAARTTPPSATSSSLATYLARRNRSDA